MSSKYPNEYDEFQLKHNAEFDGDIEGDYVMAEDINEIQSSIEKIQTALGINPQGKDSSVVNRLIKMESGSVLHVPSFLIYLGIPSLINGSTSILEATKHFARFKHVVLGKLYTEEQAVMISEVNKLTSVRFYGYIDAGVTTLNLPISEIGARIQQWMNAGVLGIYVDNFGYNSEVSRERQNLILDLIHANNGVAILNAPVFTDVLTDAEHPVLNPNWTSPNIEKGDVYHYESFGFDAVNGGSQPIIDIIPTMESLYVLRKEVGIEVFGTATIVAGTVEAQSNYDYTHGLALLTSLNAFHVAEIDRGEASNKVSYYDTLPLIGSWYETQVQIKVVNGIYERDTQFGKIKLDADGIHFEGISIPASLIQTIPSSQIQYENNSLSGDLIQDGSINDVKIANYNGNRLIDTINSITTRGVRIHFEGDNVTGFLPEDVLSVNVVEAINAYIGTATIAQAKIGNLDAEKITAGTIQAERISATVVAALELYAASAVIDKATINNALIGELEVKHIQANVIEAINLQTQTAQIGSARIEDLNADKITAGDISADRIRTNVVSAINAYVETIEGQNATFNTALIPILQSKHIETAVISAINANIGLATINSAKVGELTAGHIQATVFEAIDANITNAKISSAHIGTLTSDHIQAAVITAINANIGLATINSAKIGELQAGHIQAAVFSAIDANITNAKINSAFIGALTSNQIETIVIQALEANIGLAKIDSALINTLQAQHIQTAVISAINANIGTAWINEAIIPKLTSGHIEAVVFNAIAANINNATIDSALITNLNADKIVSGSITADLIQGAIVDAINLYASTMTVGSATINQAVIAELDAGKIKAGDIAAERMKSNIVEAANLYAATMVVGSARINQAAIGNLDAEKITAGNINADRMKATIVDAMNLYAATMVVGSAAIDQALIRDLAAEKITSGSINAERLKVTIVEAMNLYAETMVVGSATINQALIKELSADKINAGDIATDRMKANVVDAVNLKAGVITAGSAIIKSAAIDELTAGHIRAAVIQAIDFHAGTATINSAVIPELSSSHIQTNVITAINANIANGVINQAKIGELDASKITAGNITADRIATNVIAAINAEIQTAKIGAARIDALTAGHIEAVVIQAINLQTQTAKIGAARIDALTAGHIAAAVIEAINLETQTAQIKEARIVDLNATKITAGDINANRLTANVVQAINADLKTATINEAKIGNLTATKITAGDIAADRIKTNVVTAINASIDTLNATHAKIDSAAIGTLAANHMQVAVIDAVNAYVGLAVINKAKIGQLDASNIEASAITTEKLNALSIVAGKIATDAIETRHIKAAQIVAGHIQADAITAGKINADAITAREIQVDAIQTKHILAGAITANEIGVGAITAGKIFAGAIQTADLAADSITTDKIAVGAITANEILADAIKAVHIDALAVQTEHLAAGSVKADQIDALAIVAGKIAADAVTATTIAAGAVVAGKINANAVTATTIAAGAVTTDKLFASSVTADKIMANAVTADKILADSIDASKIATNAITAKHIAFNTLDGEVIRARTIHGDKIIAGTLSANILEAGSITSVEIAAKTITTRNLAAGSVDADVIRAGTITAGHISTRGLDAEQIEVYNGSTGQTLIKGGFLIVDGLDVGVVQSDNLVGNGLFLTASSAYGYLQNNPDGYTESKEAVLGNQAKAMGGHQIWKIDLLGDIVLRKVDIPGRKPVDIALDSDDTYAYITVQGDDTMIQMAIDSTNHSEVLTGEVRKVGKGPGRIRYTGDILGDHKHFFIMNTDPKDLNTPDLLTVVDGPPTSVDGLLYVHHNIPLGNGPYDSVTAVNHMTYITLSKQGDIALVDMTPASSVDWKVTRHIPIAAYGTDTYHGGLDGTVGLNGITGGDSSSKYNTGTGEMQGHVHGGYGSSDGSLTTYEPRGIALSADSGHLYVADYVNHQLVVVDIDGRAPYDSLTGYRRAGSVTEPEHVHTMSAEQEELVMTIQAGGHTGHTVAASVETTTKWVRYRIPIGDSPDFVEVVDGKVFVTLEGSGRLAVINEADILAEIATDRAYYDGTSKPMRALPIWNVRTVYLGAKPSFMKLHPTMGVKGSMYISLIGQNQIAVVDIDTEIVSKYINVGASPKGIEITQDGRYMYIVNHGGGGELSFVYPSGSYVGDPYLGLEGGVEYQGAEHWVPSRSQTHVNKDTGVVESQAKVEFRINEPFLNEGGYAKLSVFGVDIGQGTVYAQIEQDITSVINYSNGNNVRNVDNERLDSAGDWKTYRPRLGWVEGTVADIQIFSEMRGETLTRGIDNKTFRPSKDWINAPTKPTIFKGTTGNYVELRPEEYVTFYQGDADPRIVFNELVPVEMEVYSSSYFYKTIPVASDYVMHYDESTDARIIFNTALANGSWVTADFIHRDNRYWKPHNGSVLVAMENSSSPNFHTQFEIEEFVPKFVSIDNLQSEPFTFTPIHNPSRSNGAYTGLEYSIVTNRAAGATVVASSIPTSGVLTSIVDDKEPIDTTDEDAGHVMNVGSPIFVPMHDFGEEVKFPAGLQNVVIDLGKMFMIGKVVVQHGFHKKRKYHNTKTEVSEDNITWETVFDSLVDGEYNEYTDDGAGTMVYGNHITFYARPVRYIRDWSNGYTEYDALWASPVEYTTNSWAEIKAFGDWEFDTSYLYPENTAEAGQQIATNGRGVITTDVKGAYVAIDLPIEFTSWWWMTYLIGPEFGQLDVEMPTVMGGSHSLFQDGTYINKVAHRHIMSWPPSKNIKADPANNIKAGLHRAIIRQKSGKVTIDRFRFEDYQYLTKSSTEIPKDSSLNFIRRKLIPNQAQWYVGTAIQSTEGPYDTQRINTDTRLPDYSVPIKYRFIVKSRMEPQGIAEERGVAYMTSAIFETGKLSSHWRVSQTQDSISGSRIEAWDPKLPHKTGVQSFHLANGAVRGSKLMPLSVMNHHISPYAKIHESKIDFVNPTHRHGHIMMMDMGDHMMETWMDNKAVLDSIMDWAGTAGDFGIANTLARGDHKHSEYVKMNGAGVVDSGLIVKGNINLANDDLGNPGLVDGVDISALQTKVNTHVNLGGTTHPVAVPSTTVGGTDGVAGFISGDNQRKLNTVKEGATKTEGSLINGNIKIDGLEKVVYTHASTDGNKHVPANGTTNLNKVLKATATAGTTNWGNVAWSELTGTPTSLVANIDDAASKRHSQNTDVSTTSTSFTIGSSTLPTTPMGLQFGNAVDKSAIRWSGAEFQIYASWGTTNTWSTIKALTFRNSAGTEVSYEGHSHAWAEITGKPGTFTPPIATVNILGGVKQGTNVTIAADGTISGSYAVATQALSGLFSTVDKTRFDGMQSSAINQTTADARYLKLSGGTLTNGLTLEYAGPVLRLSDTDSSTGTYPQIVFDTASNQGVVLFHNEFDGELPEGNGYGLVIAKSPSNTNVQKTSLNVEGNVYADGSKVWSAATLSKSEFATSTHIHAVVTQTVDGFHSKEDKVKIDGMAPGATKVELNVAGDGKIQINDVISTVYAHPTTSGNKHIPSGGALNQYLKYSSSGIAIWSTIVWSDLSGTPSSLVVDIDNAVSLRHSQNTDTGTTSDVFTVNNDIDAVNPAAIAFGLSEKAQLKWSGAGFELYKDHSATTKIWSEVKALTFRKSDGTEVSYVGHRHFWADLMDAPTEFNPKIATSTVLGGVKQGANISISVDGTISGAYGIVTISTNGLMIAADKLKVDGISTGAKRVAGSGTNGSILIDDISTVVYTHPTGAGNNHIPIGGATNQFLKYSVSGVATWTGITFGEVTGSVSSSQHGTQAVDTLHAVATQTAHGFFAKEDKVRLDNMESNSINQVTADNRFLKLTGGTLTGDLTVSNPGDAKLILNADTDNDVVENGEAVLVLTQDAGIVGAEIKLAQGGAADNTLVLAPFMDYNTVSPIKNYSVFIHDKKIWHEGNFLKSEFTPIAHVGTNGASHAAVTTTVNGFMLFGDKVRLNAMSDGANKVTNPAVNGSISIDGVNAVVYTHPTGAGNNHVPTGGAANQYLKYSTSGVAIWATAGLAEFSGNISDEQHGTRSGGTLHAAVTTTVNGFMLFADKLKLDGIAENANNYIHPATHGLEIVTETATLKIMTDVERTKLSGIAQNANNYVHPATHALSVITETATLKIMTDVERTKLTGIAQNANNYVHPATHGLDVITETATLKIMTSTERNLLATMQSSAINQTTADGRYLQLTGGSVTGELTLGTDGNGLSFFGNARVYKKLGSGLKLQAHLDTIGVAVTNAAGIDVLVIKTDGTGMTYNANTVWHAGNLAKSEFTASSHVGTGGASHASVTTAINGFMLFGDKVKIDGISTGATKTATSTTNGNILINDVEKVVYTHPTTDGNLHVPATSTTNNTKVLKAGATAGSLAWGFVAFGEVTGTITDTQHSNRAGGALHAAVTTTVNGFMIYTDKVRLDAMSNGANKTAVSTTNGNILIDNVETTVYTHPTDKHIPTGGVTGNFLKHSVSGTAAWGNIAWSDIQSGVPATFAPSAHTHTVANITDLYGNIYTKTEVNTAVANAGNIRAENSNTFTNTNTFTKSGLVLKLQPSTEPVAGTVMFQLNSATGNSLVTMGSSTTDNQKAKFVINGDLEVTGATVQKLSQEIQGDMVVSGRLDVGGDSIFGDALTDQTTVKGDLRLEGELKPIGKALEVARFPVYGIGGDLQFQTDSIAFEDIISHYATFNPGIAGAILPPVRTGAERRYRITVAYSTVGLASDAQFKVIEYGTVVGIVEFTLPMVNGFANGMVRHFVSPEFTTNSIANITFQASSSGVSKDLIIKYIEVVAYDYYS